ncbi:MAG: SRPBCC domain-containing protein [Nonlabens sp.]
MIPSLLSPKSAIQIQKPASEVFEAIVDPEKMKKYFIAHSTGRLETGSEVKWKFPEFPHYYPVNQIKIEEHKFISFVWDPETVVEITLEPQQDKSTIVRVVENSSKKMNDETIAWAIENASGWGNFLACLKAYLEHAIQLRKGAFEFMNSENK